MSIFTLNIFKCAIQWHQAHSQSCAVITTMQNFLSSQTEALSPLTNNSLSCLPPAPSNLDSTFCSTHLPPPGALYS